MKRIPHLVTTVLVFGCSPVLSKGGFAPGYCENSEGRLIDCDCSEPQFPRVLGSYKDEVRGASRRGVANPWRVLVVRGRWFQISLVSESRERKPVQTWLECDKKIIAGDITYHSIEPWSRDKPYMHYFLVIFPPSDAREAQPLRCKMQVAFLNGPRKQFAQMSRDVFAMDYSTRRTPSHSTFVGEWYPLFIDDVPSAFQRELTAPPPRLCPDQSWIVDPPP